jgi:hypothetical protein
MHRIIGIAALLTVVACAPLALTSSAAATKSPITIKGRVVEKMNASFTLPGRFIVTQVGVVLDTGSAAVRPANGATRIVDGQNQVPVNATANLKGKKGILTIHMRGLSISINDFNPLKPGYGAEYGTWKITGGTGMYEGWIGGGRWASASTPATTYVEWDGYVTQ